MSQFPGESNKFVLLMMHGLQYKYILFFIFKFLQQRSRRIQYQILRLHRKDLGHFLNLILHNPLAVAGLFVVHV